MLQLITAFRNEKKDKKGPYKSLLHSFLFTNHNRYMSFKDYVTPLNSQQIWKWKTPYQQVTLLQASVVHFNCTLYVCLWKLLHTCINTFDILSVAQTVQWLNKSGHATNRGLLIARSNWFFFPVKVKWLTSHSQSSAKNKNEWLYTLKHHMPSWSAQGQNFNYITWVY